jgi:hypothetical protein
LGRDRRRGTAARLTTNGLTGVADTIKVARRGRNQADADIAVTGRGAEEREVAVKFDHETAAGTYLEPTPQFDVTAERRRRLDAGARSAPGGIGPTALAKEFGSPRSPSTASYDTSESSTVRGMQPARTTPRRGGCSGPSP